MKRHLLIVLLSGSLAATSLAARSAHAIEGDEVLGILLGIAALAAISSRLSDDDDKPRAATPAKPRRNGTRGGHRPFGYALPGGCVSSIRTINGDRRILGEHCLKKARVRVSSLPRSCRFSYRTRHGAAAAYSERCLREAGYRIGTRGGRYR